MFYVFFLNVYMLVALLLKGFSNILIVSEAVLLKTFFLINNNNNNNYISFSFSQ